MSNTVSWASDDNLHWDKPIGLWLDTPFLWHVVPGFAVTEDPLVICRTSHPEFLESMRLFGVPPDHPSRLEQHGFDPHPLLCPLL